MATIYIPDIEQPTLPTETFPKRQRGGWRPRPQPLIGLDLGSDNDMLLLQNSTTISWSLYHRFHHLGIIDPHELLVFHLCKIGSISARSLITEKDVEYLVLPLNYSVNMIDIYLRVMSKGIEVYDMRVL